MKMTFRWYGEADDKVTLEQVAQIPGVSGVVGCLMDIPAGEVWPMDRVLALKSQVEARGLELEVIESVNVCDAIKAGTADRDRCIENYRQTIRNLGAAGVKVVCYNFMPVFDWVKSDLDYRLPDGSTTLAFRERDVPGNPQDLLRRYQADATYELPGWEPDRLARLEELFELYGDVDEDALRGNLVYFLEAIMPTCEEAGVTMAIHPDDPPYSVFGLPRIMSTRDDLDWLCRAVPSPRNAITLCCGSVAERPDNDLYAIIEEFASRGRIAFAHVRNVCYLPSGPRDFYECAHLSSEGSLDLWRIVRALHDNGFDGYIRPDHGRMIWGETGRPGYGLFDRALGVTYINGLWEAVSKDGEARS